MKKINSIFVVGTVLLMISACSDSSEKDGFSVETKAQAPKTQTEVNEYTTDKNSLMIKLNVNKLAEDKGGVKPVVVGYIDDYIKLRTTIDEKFQEYKTELKSEYSKNMNELKAQELEIATEYTGKGCEKNRTPECVHLDKQIVNLKNVIGKAETNYKNANEKLNTDKTNAIRKHESMLINMTNKIYSESGNQNIFISSEQ